ncbi:RagB/SusD family nutrient uptake outer membrane protein [Segetibacter sp. 3557_3]|uniref:RagB/SusD family nutrient uptake outer membrane protein n=1 Tax=Segetibacter sp. 3557_3 TaxID=2547429 RepID=UPI0010588A37|nr:RagB/SusD family nutrient uptake outer membrane protein [Segetibacter sp. 3557_3]TDH28737.1 RagB/SusD family nutrient uptake outer membrane protein [Segetibacter sp. 3557_3]
MKKQFVIYTALVFVLFLVTSSCNKDFLEQLPETTRTTNTVYKTSGDFYNAVIGAYSTLKHNGLYGNGGANAALLNLGETVSDNADFGATRAVSNVSTFELEDFNFSLSNTFFSSAWTGHYIGIARTNTILSRLPAASLDKALSDRFEGEAKFLRGLFYFNLVRLFGDVQLVTTETNDPNEGYNILKSPAAKVYEQIISDLSAAETLLPAAISNAEAGRASRWAAKALLGKVYLTQKEYVKAATKLNEIIASAQFNVTANTYAAVFSNLTAFSANKDIIFAVQYKSGNIGQGSAIWSATIPWGGPATSFGVNGGSGEGFLRPTAEMINAYEPGDLRKAATVATSYMIGNTTVNERYLVKYRQNGINQNEADIDFPVLRYADVLLMYAEALVEQGQVATAVPFVNQVRTRAGLAGLSTTLSQADARMAIENERRFELAFEAHRWFDLIRTGRYLAVMTSKGYATKEFHKFYPIPQRETDLNPSLAQNEGYK